MLGKNLLFHIHVQKTFVDYYFLKNCDWPTTLHNLCAKLIVIVEVINNCDATYTFQQVWAFIRFFG